MKQKSLWATIRIQEDGDLWPAKYTKDDFAAAIKEAGQQQAEAARQLKPVMGTFSTGQVRIGLHPTGTPIPYKPNNTSGPTIVQEYPWYGETMDDDDDDFEGLLAPPASVTEAFDLKVHIQADARDTVQQLKRTMALSGLHYTIMGYCEGDDCNADQIVWVSEKLEKPILSYAIKTLYEIGWDFVLDEHGVERLLCRSCATLYYEQEQAMEVGEDEETMELQAVAMREYSVPGIYMDNQE